jgi:hypothetical protein
MIANYSTKTLVSHLRVTLQSDGVTASLLIAAILKLCSHTNCFVQYVA